MSRSYTVYLNDGTERSVEATAVEVNDETYCFYVGKDLNEMIEFSEVRPYGVWSVEELSGDEVREFELVSGEIVKVPCNRVFTQDGAFVAMGVKTMNWTTPEKNVCSP